MESNQKGTKDIKLAPINNGVIIKKSKDRNRLKSGCTELMYACQQGLTDTIVKEVRAQTNSIRKRDKSNKNTLHYCTGQKSLLPAAVIIMTAPHLMEQADEDGFKPIHLAVIQGTLETVNLLLANKVNVNALDNEGHSVVHWATVCGEAQILRTLLSAGADASIPDMNEATPLHYAAQMCGYDGKSDKTSTKLALEILGILLKHPKCSVEVEDKDGRQPLMWAASAGSEDAILALIKAGAYAESSDKDGLTALHCAASRGHTRCIELLIKLCGAQVDTIDSNGCTALFYAVTLGHADATVKLLDLGADPDRQDRKGRSPGHCGCAKGQFETVKILNARGANLWLRNARGDLPVHEAASSGRLELVEWLLQQKPNHINSSSNDGRTILHIAAGNDKIDMCKMLIEMGADVNAVYRNAKNVVKTPLDCALQKGFRSTAKYIQMHGGLPANKLRLSGRKAPANILPELDEVKPLKFTEIEVTYEQKERRRRGSETDTDSEISRGRHRHRKHRKCSHKRRTSSCSEMFICHRVDEPCEINRSKSSTELHRKRKSSKHHHQNSISSGSSESESSQSDSDDDECCYHVKRKHRCYKKVRSKSRERDSSSDKKGRKISDNKKGSESSECKETDKDQSRAKKDKKKVEIASSAKKNDNKANSASALTKGKNDSKSSTKANKKRPPSAKPGALQKKNSQDEKNRSIDKPPKTPDEPQISIDLNSKKSTTTEEASEEEKSIKEITTQAEVHEAMQQQTDVDDGVLTDATYTIEKRDKSETAVFEPQTIKEEVMPVSQESSKKVSFKSDANNKESSGVLAEGSQENSETLPQTTVDQQKQQAVDDVSKSIPMVIENEKEKAFSQLPSEIDDSDELLPENIQRPKSQTPESIGSFTILEDGDDAEQKLKEFEEMTQDDYQQQQLGQQYDDDSGEQYYDDSSSMEKVPKRTKEGFKVLDDGKDQDSGIEPSPRSQRTKIPGPRSTHSSTATSVTRRSFLVTEDRPRSTRIEGRKPGDKNACNMTTVTQSIQKNIRRYYMERKIFQHLLELKSLQIRSCKSNEAVLVKRAVDDYHKSVADLGFEVGGTLSRYQMREYTFKNFELFLYETLKSLQKPGTFNFQNIAEVYREAERRLSPDFSRCEKALYCTTKTHRCLHAAHAYTGIPCAAYLPLMNHHTMPKIGFGSYKGTGNVGTFYLPKILTSNQVGRNKVSLEFSNTNNKKYSTSVPLPSDKLDSNKRYLVTFTVKDKENQQQQLKETAHQTDEDEESK
ncbi:hypothetical protein PVAND_002915 [Polypedilum vanderplanki]|uniref:Uncharacterized protein n=1 Tax=Polypedilum vanderplanki TaxID=319348 RepID=A0A9J6BSG8_POLVA|nr:hypothetical protein PVAND_002915 [Polypedilum vanderplanki]